MNTPRARHAWEQAVSSWDTEGAVELGPHTSHKYRIDPKHLCFVLSRYKFCAKLLSGTNNVLEVGCGDAFGTPVVAQEARMVLAIDWDPRLIESNSKKLGYLENCTFKHHDIVADPVEGKFDGVYSVDVLEHIDPVVEDKFMRHTCGNLTDDGTYIVGTPNLNSEAYASEASKLGHINLKDASGLKKLLSRYLKTVFVFSMNDEVVHTGFYPMAHYLFAVGVGPKTGQ